MGSLAMLASFGWGVAGGSAIAQSNEAITGQSQAQRVSPFSSTGQAIYNPFSNSLGVNDAGIPKAYNLLFVDPAAGDNVFGDGTAQSPFKTITYALKVAQPNMVVLLAPGIYSARSGEKFPLQLKPQVTLQGAPGFENGAAVIYGGGDFLSPTLSQQNATVLGEDNAGLSGVTITNPYPSGYGIWIEASSPTVVSNIFTNPAVQSIFVAGNSNPRIEGNSIKPDPSQLDRSPLSRPSLPPILSSGSSSSSLFPQGSASLGPTPGTPIPQPSAKVSATTIDLEDVPQGSAVEISAPSISPAQSSQSFPSASPSPVVESSQPLSPDAGSENLLNSTPTNGSSINGKQFSGLSTGETSPDFPKLSLNSVTITPRPDAQSLEASQGQSISWGETLVTSPGTASSDTGSAQTALSEGESEVIDRTSLALSASQETAPDVIEVPVPQSSETESTAVSLTVKHHPVTATTVQVKHSAPVESDPLIPSSSAQSTAEQSTPRVDSTLKKSSNRPDLPELESLPEPNFLSNQALPVPNIQQAPLGNVAELPAVTVTRAVTSAGDPPFPPTRAEVLGLRYRVLVDAAEPKAQEQVKDAVPDAFRTVADGRTVMQAGAFRDRAQADDLVHFLQNSGLSARVEALK